MTQFALPVCDEIIVDNFAGGGGASLGIEMATGRCVDVAVNHDRFAIAMHAANHPGTRHMRESVWAIDPIEVTEGRPVGIAWFSPDCTHFSKAKGGKPVKKAIRGLAWVVLEWTAKAKPRLIFLENVEEFETWGPLTRSGRPCPIRKGQTFQKWLGQLQALGYRADLARVTAERDDYRSRWEQTGCTRHHAMETAIKLNESCRQQLEAAIQERDTLREALDFYACVDHYAGGCADDVVSTDRGAKARAALNGEGDG